MNKKEKEIYKNLSSYEADTIKWIRKTRPKIYTLINHVSQSGMLRIIDVFALRNNNKIWLSPLIEKMTSYNRDNTRDGLRVGGCGMDMGFAVVYAFSKACFPTGFKYRINEHHRNNDPSLRDNDGGYALRQEWF